MGNLFEERTGQVIRILGLSPYDCLMHLLCNLRSMAIQGAQLLQVVRIDIRSFGKRSRGRFGHLRCGGAFVVLRWLTEPRLLLQRGGVRVEILLYHKGKTSLQLRLLKLARLNILRGHVSLQRDVGGEFWLASKRGLLRLRLSSFVLLLLFDNLRESLRGRSAHTLKVVLVHSMRSFIVTGAYLGHLLR